MKMLETMDKFKFMEQMCSFYMKSSIVFFLERSFCLIHDFTLASEGRGYPGMEPGSHNRH